MSAALRRACSTACSSSWPRSTRFIATLGTGTVIYAIALWHTGGRQVVGTLPPGLHRASTRLSILGVPIPGRSTCSLLAVVLWLVTEFMPLGRYLYAIGANPRAAALNGIPRPRAT